MTDDRHVPERLLRSGESPVQLSDILAIADWFREDIAAAKADLMAVIVEDRKARRDWEFTHTQEHVSDSADRKVWDAKLTDLLESEKLAKARRDGILGAIRFVFDVIGRNWRGILALAGTAAVFLGNVHVNIS